MSAIIIAFPVPRRTKAPASFYEALRDYTADLARENLATAT